MMWDPRNPSKSPEDDDLEVFFDDDEFRKLLGEKEAVPERRSDSERTKPPAV